MPSTHAAATTAAIAGGHHGVPSSSRAVSRYAIRPAKTAPASDTLTEVSIHRCSA